MKTFEPVDNEDIIREWGSPFIRYGKKSYQFNPNFFVELFYKKNNIKIFTNNTFYLFNGNNWEKISENLLLNHLEKLILNTAVAYDINIIAQLTEKILNDMLQKLKRRHSEELLPILNEDILPAQNCILYWDETIKDFRIENYSSNDFVKHKFAVDYNPLCQAPCFEAMLKRNIPDQEDRRVIQEYLGAALFSKNRTRKFLVCTGEGGCGKSILVLILISILTDIRVFDLQIEHLKKNYELSALLDQTLFTVSESISNAFCTSGAEWVKKAVGGDYFETKQKFKNEKVKHYGLFSMIVVSNNTLKFQFEGRGDEWRDRIIPISFNQHIPEEERDKELVTHLLLNEGAGIFNWFLDGARRVRRNKWQIELSTLQKDRIEKLLSFSDPIGVFVQNHINYSAGEHFLSSEAWQLYVRVRNETGFPILTEDAFYKKLAAAMIKINHTCACNSLPGKKRGYRDFKLK